MKFFGKPKKTPIEEARSWAQRIRRESRALERKINSDSFIVKIELNYDLAGAKTKVKDYASKSEIEAAKIIAKQVVLINRTISQHYITIGKFNSLEMSINSHIATMRMSTNVQKSTEVLKSLNSLINLSETHEISMQLCKEMTKAGIIEEMIDEVINPPDEDLDEEANMITDEAIESVLQEIVGEVQAPPSKTLQTSEKTEEKIQIEDPDFDEMQKRLEMLKQI
ncbi:hypothetical protein HZS_4147 [Henneguya salminicola]|nr:hypothetical protein HZS_4147 [Henneguya salminicola]